LAKLPVVKNSLFKRLLKFLKITVIVIGSLLLLLFLAPYIFPNTVAEKIKQWTNSSIKGEVNFSRARLSFFNHFPSLTLSLHDFSLKGSAPYQNDTLVAAEKISFGINLKTLLFDKKIKINKIFLTHALIDAEVNEKGEANYNIYESKKEQKQTPESDTSGASLRLERIEIDQSHLIYHDRSVPLIFEAKNFNYKGTGDLSEAIFDLKSHIKIDSLDFILNNEPYLRHKKIDADLITKINTNSLSFIFGKNNLAINQLQLQFSGKLDILKTGYNIDLGVSSGQSDFHDFITALPPQYVSWLQKTQVKGTAALSLALRGQYIASTNQEPTLSLNMKIRNGYVAYENAPVPASNLMADLDIKLPSFNTDSLQVNLDSLFFTLNKNYFRTTLHTVGLAQPFIRAKADAQMDLEELNKAFGIQSIDTKGKINLHLTAEGKYATGLDPKSFRKKDTVILSFPSFTLESSLRDGYLKYKTLPEPVTNINLVMHATCPGHDYKMISLKIDTLNAIALNNYLKGSALITSLKDFPLEANLQSDINLADIKKCYPIDSLDLSGLLKLNINTKGKYAPEKKLFPQVAADIEIQNGLIQTKYYPHPIKDIQVNAKANDADGSLSGLKVSVEPASFLFEGKTFFVKANLQNFDDILYNIKAKGEIDIGKIYQVFAQQGIDVSGYAKAAISLKGRQSDGTNGRYDRLENSGTVELKNIELKHEYFPKSFFIKEGLFSFRQDKMWFDKFSATYGHSDMKMDGFLENLINYFFTSDGKLKGNFNLNSDFISVDEFTAFSNQRGTGQEKKPVQTDSTSGNKSTGVVMIPANLDLIIKANVNSISYNGLNIKNFSGGVTISNAQLQLNETNFSLIDCTVAMNGLYGNTSPTRAFFQYHLQAKDFDIKKAYNQVKLFHDMFTSAAKAEGIISLDYDLKGRLNGDMYPIYPSLTGGGVLSIKNVRFKGLKLFNVVSSTTEKDIRDPDLSKIDLKTTIKNNLITLERVKFKTSGFRIRMEGQTSFDGNINLKMRIGLPPLGIIGIPMHITGTSENPKIKLNKNDKEELTEKEDQEGEN